MKGKAKSNEFGERLSCGRGERIRTSDLSVPNRAHYQAVLRPDEVRHSKRRVRAGQVWPQIYAGERRSIRVYPRKSVAKNSFVWASARARWLMRFLMVSGSWAKVWV